MDHSIESILDFTPHAAHRDPDIPVQHPLQYFENIHKDASDILKAHVEKVDEFAAAELSRPKKQQVRDEMAKFKPAEEPNRESVAQQSNSSPHFAGNITIPFPTTPSPPTAQVQTRTLTHPAPGSTLTVHDLHILWKWVSGMKAALTESLRLHTEIWATAKWVYLCECSGPSKGENCFSQRRMVQRLGEVNALLLSLANAMAVVYGAGCDREYCLSALAQAQAISEFLEQL